MKDKKKRLSYIVIGLMIAVSVTLCIFVFFVKPPFPWLTSVLFAVESLLWMALAKLRKTEHYKTEFYSSLASFFCFTILAILEMF